MAATGARKAVFLDRDGVIVVPEFRDGRSFAPRRLEDFHFYPDADAALRRLKDAGFLLIVVTNQPDVGNGRMSRGTLDEMNRRMMAQFPLDAVKVCSHQQDENCACRKPKPGLLLEAAQELGALLPESFMVGDRASDIEAAAAAGCKSVFIDLGYTSEPRPDNTALVAKSLGEAADIILTTST